MAESHEDRSSSGRSQAASTPGRRPPASGGRLAELAQRFDRQVRFAPLGPAGQANLVSARVLVVGCGALGGVIAQTLFRAGVGELVLVDRDVVEISNLPRQVLFDEQQARAGMPKALAARETLERSGGPTAIRAHVLHVDARNLGLVADDVDLILDGTDNLETRYLLNDFCVERRLAWVYAGVVGSSGLVLPILPGRSACLACLFPEPPPEGVLPTCDTAGVLLPAVGAVASFAAGFGLRLIARPHAEIEPALIELDTWNGTVRRLSAPRDPACRACVRGELAFLHRPGAEAIALCGRNTVQIPAPPPDAAREPRVLATVARRLPGDAREVQLHPSLLRFAYDGCRISLFPDGRALVEGTADVERARTLYERALGPARS